MTAAATNSHPPLPEADIRQALNSLEGLDSVEAIIRSKLEAEVPLLTEISEYLRELGGKRVRPVLALLTGKLCGLASPPPALLEVAAGIELIHMATLLHDDIIDQSPLRRRKTSPYLKFGINNSLLTGDFLLVRAFSLCAQLDQEIVDATERACVHLVEGEILEIPLYEEGDLSLENSLEIARKKTAALFKLAAYSGGHIAGASAEVQAALSRFGEQLGIAFQILDDILDVVADENLLGKKSGIDLRERKPSVVNVMWLESGSELAKRLLLQKDTPATEDAWVAQALEELRTSSSVTAARRLALQHATRASQDLEIAHRSISKPDQASFLLLNALIQFTISRLA